MGGGRKKKKKAFVPRFVFKVVAGGGSLIPVCCAAGLSSMEVACVATAAFVGVACVGFDGGPCGVGDSGKDAHDGRSTPHEDARFGVADVGFRDAGPMGVAMRAFDGG